MARVTWTEADLAAHQRKMNTHRANKVPDTGTADAGGPHRKASRQRKGPNHTESEYRCLFLDVRMSTEGVDIRYEGIMFRLRNGHNYSPDWIVTRLDGAIEAHECKGGYHLHSHGRAQLAFDQAKLEWPLVFFVWAEKTKDHGWEIS